MKASYSFFVIAASMVNMVVLANDQSAKVPGKRINLGTIEQLKSQGAQHVDLGNIKQNKSFDLAFAKSKSPESLKKIYTLCPNSGPCAGKSINLLMCPKAPTKKQLAKSDVKAKSAICCYRNVDGSKKWEEIDTFLCDQSLDSLHTMLTQVTIQPEGIVRVSGKSQKQKDFIIDVASH